MGGPDLMCVGSSDSSKNVLKVIKLISQSTSKILQIMFIEIRKRSDVQLSGPYVA